ncbi:tRNA 5-methoxyuridine(34)/uridine 5-oxyacetic acid(34) synthase CmoB [Candidatus Profftia sp. (ex Adelges kitamiensis)]|nr:tRNA 5-methoxyuridine(34)/uridine 5-oxyacetic acid(34) synthase CmoB [Candidatus Profftia sp. (ex Adelges kitamiensis)]
MCGGLPHTPTYKRGTILDVWMRQWILFVTYDGFGVHLVIGIYPMPIFFC